VFSAFQMCLEDTVLMSSNAAVIDELTLISIILT